MASEFVAGEGLSGLPWYLDPWPLAALAALGLGLALAQGLRALLTLERREDVGAHRSTLASLFLSLALAAGALLVSGPSQAFLAQGGLTVWALVWLGAGLAAGLFPRGAGLPLLALAGLLCGLTLALVLPLHAAIPGAVLAKALPLGADEGPLRLSLSGPLAPYAGDELTIELPPGPFSISLDVVEFSGPLALAFGPRRVRLVGLASQTGALVPYPRPAFTLLDLPGFRGAHAAGGLALPGLRTRRLVSEARLPEPLVERVWRLDAEGRLLE